MNKIGESGFASLVKWHGITPYVKLFLATVLFRSNMSLTVQVQCPSPLCLVLPQVPAPKLENAVPSLAQLQWYEGKCFQLTYILKVEK